MCMIAASISGRKMTKTEFKEAWNSNSDGFGYAYAKDGRTFFSKGYMRLKAAWRIYHDIPDGVPHVAHFRMATHGAKCQELTHPFICEWSDDIPLVGITDKPVLFHNGVYTAWDDTLLALAIKHGDIPRGDISDTRVIAMLVGEIGVRALDFIDGKFAVFTSGKLLIDGKWASEADGIKFSSTAISYMCLPHLGRDNEFYTDYYNDYGYVTHGNQSLDELEDLVDDSNKCSRLPELELDQTERNMRSLQDYKAEREKITRLIEDKSKDDDVWAKNKRKLDEYARRWGVVERGNHK